jgi:hypothetical protein
LNDRAATYKRRHVEMGTVQLKDQHGKDLLLLCDVIKNNFLIHDFFPDLDDNDRDQLLKAWLWFGNLYCGFGAYNYADECYKKAYSLRKSLFSVVGIKYIIGAKMLNSGVFRFLARVKTILNGTSRR